MKFSDIFCPITLSNGAGFILPGKRVREERRRFQGFTDTNAMANFKFHATRHADDIFAAIRKNIHVYVYAYIILPN